mgnify:CR=1 FL=1
MSDHVTQVLIPKDKVFQIRKGKKVSKERNFFPGYIFVEADLNGEIPHISKYVTSVIGFLGDTKGGAPVPLRQSEVNRILGKVDELAESEGWPKLRELIAEANASGAYTLPRKAGIIRGQAHGGEWRANLTQISRDGGPINGADADDLSFAEVQGRRQVVLLVALFLRGAADLVPVGEALGASVLARGEGAELAGVHVLVGVDVHPPDAGREDLVPPKPR